jgi:hypothetical protein
MRSLLRIVCVGAAVVIAYSHARAEKTMTIDFVGEWCFDSQDKNVSGYMLPTSGDPPRYLP